MLDIKDFVRLANYLDEKGLSKEADKLDKFIEKIASLKLKVHPLEAAVALGELPAHLLEDLAPKDEEPSEKDIPDSEIKGLLDLLQKEKSSKLESDS